MTTKKKFGESLKENLRIPILILQVVVFIFVMRWLGIKGFIGVLIGVVIVGVLIATKNSFLLMILKICRSEAYMEEMLKGENNEAKGKKEPLRILRRL